METWTGCGCSVPHSVTWYDCGNPFCPTCFDDYHGTDFSLRNDLVYGDEHLPMLIPSDEY